MQPQGGALGHADALGHSAPGPRRARMEFRPLDQQEYGPPMAEPGRPQTASGSPVAAQSRSGVSRESPPIVRLYLHPPRGTRVISVDEKTQQQILEAIHPPR